MRSEPKAKSQIASSASVPKPWFQRSFSPMLMPNSALPSVQLTWCSPAVPIGSSPSTRQMTKWKSRLPWLSTMRSNQRSSIAIEKGAREAR